MTMPIERTRNLVQAGAFLRDLSANKSVSPNVRAEAHRLLRHFPSISDVEAIARNEMKLLEITKSGLVKTYLSAEIDPDWVRGYAHGPHIGG